MKRRRFIKRLATNLSTRRGIPKKAALGVVRSLERQGVLEIDTEAGRCWMTDPESWSEEAKEWLGPEKVELARELLGADWKPT